MTHSAFIAGAWRAGALAPFTSKDPATGETVWEGAAAGPDDVRAAFDAARKAFAGWALAGFETRRAIAERYGELVKARQDEIGLLIARETGKPLWEARGEAGAMAAKVGVSITAYEDRTGRTHTETEFGEQVLDHKPLGVMFVLGPYNFPGHLPNGHVIPALLAGNTIVFKPSELTPAVGELMVKLWDEAGLPAGVLNLVQGARDTGAAALADPDLDGVLFTGSWATGSMIHKLFAGRTGVQLALEMGGNNPLVVWNAEDAEAAARIAVLSSYITAGQRCSCARRLIVPAGRDGEAVIEAIAAAIPKLPIGPYTNDPEPFMGPLISGKAAGGVLQAQDDLIKRGAKAFVEAARHQAGEAFVTPGLIGVDGVETADEEVFGPLLTVRRATNFDEALKLANATAYGLSAGLVSDDDDLWAKFWTLSRAGIVNRNRPTTGAASTMPFGGPGQ
ncbi:MAG: succinylglutamate-semialdehyde dehydrogenase, partial [Oceanicaulis sp.]